LDARTFALGITETDYTVCLIREYPPFFYFILRTLKTRFYLFRLKPGHPLKDNTAAVMPPCLHSFCSIALEQQHYPAMQADKHYYGI
jgi:hypothetical protein